jgi:AraC-like DNA-binding protein
MVILLRDSRIEGLVCTIYAVESLFLSRSSRIAADPLSGVLSLLRLRGYMSGGVDAGGEWAFGFDGDGVFRCVAVASGCCWLVVDSMEAVRLEAGDFVVLPRGKAFRLASDPAVAPVDLLSILDAPLQGGILSWQGGGGCVVLSALFTFAAEHASLLAEVLPPVVLIRNRAGGADGGAAGGATMHWYLERMMAVVREPQPGSVLLGETLAQMMLIEVLRLHIAENGMEGVGWLFALGDRQLRAAMAAMHERPGHRWTVQELAERAGMSRSAFALRFREKAGSSVMEYLTRWRMLLAGDRLMNSDESVSEIALSLGYESESAFGFAFKREMGRSPRRYGLAGQAGAARAGSMRA